MFSVNYSKKLKEDVNTVTLLINGKEKKFAKSTIVIYPVNKTIQVGIDTYYKKGLSGGVHV